MLAAEALNYVTVMSEDKLPGANRSGEPGQMTEFTIEAMRAAQRGVDPPPPPPGQGPPQQGSGPLLPLQHGQAAPGQGPPGQGAGQPGPGVGGDIGGVLDVPVPKKMQDDIDELTNMMKERCR